MFNVRRALALAGLAFATWETIDIFWISTPAVAAVMALLFLSCTIWYWRRDSLRAAIALLVLFAFEGAVAPTLKTMTVTKVADLALAVAGALLAVTVIVEQRRGHVPRAMEESRSG